MNWNYNWGLKYMKNQCWFEGFLEEIFIRDAELERLLKLHNEVINKNYSIKSSCFFIAILSRLRLHAFIASANIINTRIKVISDVILIWWRVDILLLHNTLKEDIETLWGSSRIVFVPQIVFLFSTSDSFYKTLIM